MVRCLMIHTPEDNSPSKSAYSETEMGDGGTQMVLECRSEWNYGNHLRIGELVLWTDGAADATSVLMAQIRNIRV